MWTVSSAPAGLKNANCHSDRLFQMLGQYLSPPRKKKKNRLGQSTELGEFAGHGLLSTYRIESSFCKPEVFSMLELTYRRKDLIFGLVIHSPITIQLVPTLHQGFASNGWAWAQWSLSIDTRPAQPTTWVHKLSGCGGLHDLFPKILFLNKPRWRTSWWLMT